MAVRYSVCPHDCPDTCAWRVHVEGDRIIKIEGDPDQPVTRGMICAKARYYPERVHGRERILYPMRRRGAKGSGDFVRISWSDALDEIVSRWQDLIARHGAECILPFSYAGTEGIVQKASMDRRFFHRLGATRLERTICSAAGAAGYSLVYGASKGINPLTTVQAKLLVFWGINVLETNLHQALLAVQARRQGARVIAIDVHRNRTADWADEFFHILPGSDGALALGVAHILFRDGLVAREWAERHTAGLTEFSAAACDYPPERVSRLTGLSVAQIERLAHLYGEARPSFIRIGNGLQHHDNGGMNTWAIACLPALTGAWQDCGGGALKFNSAYFPLNRLALERPDLLPGSPREVNMNQLGWALTELDPPLYALYVYNSNPAAVVPCQDKVFQGLAREDLFTVVHEQVWTDTARWGDIVLPATTALEHADLYVSYWHCLIQWADPAIPPVGESKPNSEVFGELAQRFGFEEDCFHDSIEDIAGQALDLPYWRVHGITVERLRRERWIALPEVPEVPFAAGGFPTPSGKAELSGKRALDLGLPPVPAHVPLVEGPESAKTGELILISPPNHSYLNSTFADVPELREQAGEPYVEIHPKDAARHGIKDGEFIVLANGRGSCTLRARVADSVRPGVAVAPGVPWARHFAGGRSINVLTPDRFADLGHGATFFSTLVRIAKTTED